MVDRAALSRSQPLAGIRLLVVEDHADCLSALKILLESKGAEVQAASSVAEARAARPGHSRCRH